MTELTSASLASGPYPTAPRRVVPAWLMSVFLHVFLLTTAAILMAVQPRGSGAPQERLAGIAVVERLPDRDVYKTPDERSEPVENPTDAEDSQAAMAAAPPAAAEAPLDLEGALAELTAAPMPSASGTVGDAMAATESALPGTGPLGDGGAQQTTTKVFGISGTGSRFVYVFDRSDSMNGYGGAPLRAAKRELISSLRTLTEQQRFQIVFYNNRPKPFVLRGVGGGMMEANKSNKLRAETYVENITAFGGTQHEGALRLALKMQPDVIFFLTDARIPRLTDRDLREIRARARQAGTAIHAIEFGGSGPPGEINFLQKLAEQNAGQYRFVDVTTLGQARRRPEDAAP